MGNICGAESGGQMNPPVTNVDINIGSSNYDKKLVSQTLTNSDIVKVGILRYDYGRSMRNFSVSLPLSILVLLRNNS